MEKRTPTVTAGIRRTYSQVLRVLRALRALRTPYAFDGRWRIVAAVGIAALLPLAACGGSSASPRQRRMCALVIDVSASIDQKVIDQYKTGVASVITGCAGGSFSADVATENSQASVCPSVAVDLVPAHPRDNKLYDDAQTAQLSRQAETRTAELINCATGRDRQRTDLFGALVGAGKTLSARPNTPRELTVFTDAVSTRRPFNLATSELEPADITGLLDQLGRDSLIATLTGVDVRMVGAGAGVDFDPSRLRRLEDFWRTYVTRAGGRLTAYGKTTEGA